MKRSEFIKRVLRSRRNTVFTTKEQVEVALKIFESLGILPPETGTDDTGYFHEWESEDE